jgi:hypothetical protein
VQHGTHAVKAATDHIAVGDRPRHGGERRSEHVDADDIPPRGAQDTYQRLAEMPGTARHQNSLARHGQTICRPV